jgi:hypothetical protein
MKATARLAAAAASLALALALGLPAVGSDGRYAVRCVDTTGDAVAKDFESRVIEEAGGKAHALELFKQKHPDGRCWVARPSRVHD